MSHLASFSDRRIFFRVMSTTIIFAIFGVVLAISCVGSWQLALRWHNRTRDAQREDPRDQEIRELSAALNIARKEVEKLDNANVDLGSEITKLKEKLHKTDDSLNDTKEKYNATKENLTKEIEGREGLQEEVRQLQGDLERSNARLEELEVQLRMDSSGSGFVAGLDDMLDDDEKESSQIRQEHKLLKQQLEDLQSSAQDHEAESAKWKQHCTVMSKTNKTLRAKLDETAEAQLEIDSLREEAVSQTGKIEAAKEELSEALTQHEQLQTELEQHETEIASLKTEGGKTSELQVRVTELESEAEELQQQADNANEFESKFKELTEASVATLAENREMQKQLEAVEAIETDNQRLMGELKELRSSSASELHTLQQENSELKVRVDAIESIQQPVNN